MFKCPNCNRDTSKLIARHRDKIYCPYCYTQSKVVNSAKLHNTITLPSGNKVTLAEKEHYFKRTVSDDGNHIVYKNNKDKLWSF